VRALWFPAAAESALSLIGPITLGAKHPGKPGTGKPYAGFDEAGVGNVTEGAGLRPTAKALDEPPDPTVGAPIPDPACKGLGVRFPHDLVHGQDREK
jgi:hypothetical protein